MSNVKDVPIKSIKVVENHRTNIDKTGLHELMQSIKQNGLQQPIGVSKDKRGGYTLLFGHRRMLACQKLGWNTIPASVDEEVSEEKFLIANLTENMQRKDPSFAELGRIIDKLQTKMKLSTKEVAARLGLPEAKIRAVVSVYQELPEKLRSRVTFMEKGGGRKSRRGMIPANVATKIVGLKRDHGLNNKTVERVFDHVRDNGADKLDLDNLGVMMNQGMSAVDALENMAQFKVYTFDFVAAVEEVQHLMTGNSIYSNQELFRRILYGEAPSLKRPHFLKVHALRAVKKAGTIKKNGDAWKRFAAMRTNLMLLARQGDKLNDTQILALKPTGKIHAKQWSPEQCAQIESIYREHNK